MSRLSFSQSEKKILAKIRRSLPLNYRSYDFWFVYEDNDEDNGEAIGWEGGFELGQQGKWRNQYTIEQGKQVKKNWE